VADVRSESYGEDGLTVVDRFGVWLSRRAISRQLPASKHLRVLDLGCGHDATLLRALGDRVETGVGVDISVSDKARSAPRLEFIEAPIAEALPQIEDSSQDLVLLISVLEHLSDAQPTLDEIHRVLAPGGRVLINVPTWRGKSFLEFSAFRLGTSPAIEMDDHKRYYDRRDLWPMLIAAGFKPSHVKIKYHKFRLNLFARAQRS
jgi:SAM-dependent methyltransferase